MKNFSQPSFSQGELELRCEVNEVAIYATQSGLSKLAELCAALAQKKVFESEHIHLEDYELLTPKSLKGVIAVFESH